MNKTELMEKIKSEIKWYARPRSMGSRSKEDLQQMYDEAKKLGLINEVN